MKSSVTHLWTSLHWASCVAMLLVLFAIQWWQARYTWTIRNPTYGWPVSFNNLFIGYERPEWNPWFLALDVAVWLVLLASVGYTLERLWTKANPFQFSLGSLCGGLGVIAVLLALGCAEGFLRANPNIFTICPKYASRDLWGVTIGLDLGLFTDPPLDWPLARISIIVAIGCVVYSSGSLILNSVRRRDLAMPSRLSRKEPVIARFIQLALVVMDAFLLIGTSFPPTIH